MVNNKINVNVIDGLQPILDRVIDYDNITNCITEIPQDIKLEIESTTDQYPELILKAGSKVYVSTNGIFNPITIQSDIKGGGELWTASHSRELLVVYVPSSGRIQTLPVQYCFSQNTAPTSFLVDLYAGWFDTSTNTVKYTIDGGSNWIICSLPICLGRPGENYVGWNGYLDQVFNGFGYIGSTVFALPGVKLLHSNGRNADGTLRNNEVILTKVLINSTYRPSTDGYLICSGNAANIQKSATKSNWCYDEENNYVSTLNGDKGWMIWGEYITDGNDKITSFTPKLPFRAVDQNDFNKLDEEVIKTSGNQTINNIKTFKGAITRSHEFTGGSAKTLTDVDTNGKGSIAIIPYYTGNKIYHRTYVENTTSGKHAYLDVTVDDSGIAGLHFGGSSSTFNVSFANATQVTVPTPATADNSSRAATTAFFRNNMQVVSALPSSPAAGVFYFIKE